MNLFKSYLFLSFFIVQASAYTELTDEEQSVASAVWMLQTEHANGTSFFIAPNRIVTNFHVVVALLKKTKLQSIKLLQETDQGQIESDLKITKILALSATFDLAILETNKSTNSYLKVETNSDKETDALFTLGYPHKQFSKINKTGPLQILSDKFVFSIDHANIGGASGSPVFNTKNQMVGVVIAHLLHLQYSIQTDLLQQFIEGKVGLQCKNPDKKCINEAIAWMIKKAEEGDGEAQYNLSLMYLSGDGIEQNRKKAFYWTQETVKQEHVLAQYQLGLMYHEGVGVEQNMDKAIEWFLKAAKQGLTPAQELLGIIYLHGIGVTVDTVKALYWIEQAAKAGFISSQYILGEMYLVGEGVEKNLNQAFEWLLKAAEKNYAPAQTKLGFMYFFGDGGRKI